MRSTIQKRERIKATVSSGNVFADIGLPNATERFHRADLAHAISTEIRERNLTQVKAAALLGIDQPKLSHLIRGNLGGYSTDRLLRFLRHLNQDIEIVVKPSKSNGFGHVSVVQCKTR